MRVVQAFLGKGKLRLDRGLENVFLETFTRKKVRRKGNIGEKFCRK